MSTNRLSDLQVSQNFLKDSHLVTSLINQCGIGGQDVVYEIGPGKGIITVQLARRCRHVIAIEKDPALASQLQKKLAHFRNLTLSRGDCLHDRLPAGPYKVFANIPFNISSAIVARLTNAPNPPEEAYLVLQKETAALYLGSPHESLRSLLLKPWFEMSVVHHFRRHDFTPQPKVDAVLLQICKRSPSLVCSRDRQLYRDFIVACFTTWRPTLGDILKTVFTYRQLKHLSRELRCDLKATPTGIAFGDWLKLFDTFQKYASPQAFCQVSGSEKRLICQQQKLEKVHRTRVR